MLAPQIIPAMASKANNNFFESYHLAHGGNHADLFQNLSPVKKLGDSKFPVYLVSSPINNQTYAAKVFSHPTEDTQGKFKNEIRFAPLNHPFIVKFVHYEQNKEIVHQGQPHTISYILTEYAPHGDLFDFIIDYRAQIEEKLIRTYFRQLIDAIEYLHGNGIAHLDLKPENILIGADYNIKICDFDLSYMYGDSQILSKGTKNYRAPEFFKSASSSSSRSEISFAADIYSAGVILFLLKTEGFYPHTEEDSLAGINFFDLMCKNNSKFWKNHKEIQGKGSSFFDSNFKDLFDGMTKLNPKDRLTISKIKKSKWYNGPVYPPMELKEKMKRLLNH